MSVCDIVFVSIDLSTAAKFALGFFFVLTHALQAETP